MQRWRARKLQLLLRINGRCVRGMTRKIALINLDSQLDTTFLHNLLEVDNILIGLFQFGGKLLLFVGHSPLGGQRC